MEACVTLMLDNLKKPTKYESLYKKYSSRKFMKASIFVRGWIEEQQLDCDASESEEDEGEDDQEDDEE